MVPAMEPRTRWIALAGLVLALALFGAGCGDDAATTEATSSVDTGSSTDATTTEAESPSPSEDGSAAPGTTELYFTAGEQFRTVERDLPAAGSEQAQLTAAAEALVAGPTRQEAATEVETATQIPEGTQVEDVALAGDGTAVVEVSPEFTAGIPTDPADRTRADDSELDARVSQVTFTLTQFPKVEAAKVVSGGVPIEPAAKRSDLDRPKQGPRRLDRPKGERGSSVRSLQQRLAELRYLPESAVDGVAGYRTQQAVIAFQSWRGLERDGVVGPATTAALAKASPPSPQGDGPSRRIEVHRAKGVALLVKGGETLRAIHVSTGGPGTETPSGTYGVFRKELRSWSVPFQTWLPYASYFNNGIAFHEYPDVPTYPASHGCVRVPAPEAKGLYRFAKIDTAVLVF